MCGGQSVLTSHFKYWVTFSVLAIAAVSLAWWDPSDVLHSSLSLVAAVTGMMYTMLAGRGWIVCYAFGLVNAPLYAYHSWRWGYYGDMALNLYYLAMWTLFFVDGCYCYALWLGAGRFGIMRSQTGR